MSWPVRNQPLILGAHWKRGQMGKGLGNLRAQLPPLRMAGPECPQGHSGSGQFRSRAIQLLLRHDFVRQFTRYHFAQFVAFLPRFDHGISRAIMLGDDG